MNDDTNKPVLDLAGIGDGVLGLLRALLGAVLKPGNCIVFSACFVLFPAIVLFLN